MSALPPFGPGEKAVVDRLLADWQHTEEWVTIPPLSSLNWRILKEGTTLPADSLIITDRDASVTLGFSLDQFKPSFVDAARAGQVLGYQVAGDRMDVTVTPSSVHPVRPTVGVHIEQASILAVVTAKKGNAIYSVDREDIARNYGALEAHNPPYPARTGSPAMFSPSLAPAPVHLKRGLGIRGKDLATLGPDVVRVMKLDGNEGVYVDGVIPGSPADRSGIMERDVIRHVDAMEIRNKEDLRKALAEAADAPVTVEVLRYIFNEKKTQTFNIKVQLGEVNGDANVVPRPAPTGVPSSRSTPAGSASPRTRP